MQKVLDGGDFEAFMKLNKQFTKYINETIARAQIKAVEDFDKTLKDKCVKSANEETPAQAEDVSKDAAKDDAEDDGEEEPAVGDDWTG